MSNTLIQDEMTVAMHEFVQEYLDGEADLSGEMINTQAFVNEYHQMIDDPTKRLTYSGKMSSEWEFFVEAFQEYITNQ